MQKNLKKLLSVLVIVGLLFSCVSCSSPPDEGADEGEVEVMETEVLVVGSGLAGLSAAVKAAEEGAEVIVLEKMSAIGGNSALSGAGIGAPASAVQKEHGIVDCPEDYVELWMEYNKDGRPENPAPVYERCLFIAERAAEIIDWLISLGYEFDRPTDFDLIEGVDRFHYPSNYRGGAGQVQRMAEVAEEKGVEILLETRATELITDDSGAVVGVKAKQNGETKEFRAKAVVLATGGFAQSPELVERFCPEHKDVISVASVSNTGDGILMAEEIGAALFEYPWLMGMSYRATADPQSSLNMLGGPWEQSPLVDRTGARFINEYCHPLTYSTMIIRDAGPYYCIYGSDDEETVTILEENLDSGLVFKGETLEELAKVCGFDTETFVTTIERYCEGKRKGKDEDFDARVDFMVAPETGPYYAVQMTPTNMGSIGGIKTNTNAEVLRTDGSVIKGLYAAGEVANGDLYDIAYMSGTSVLNCYVMGRIAGENAARLAAGAN